MGFIIAIIMALYILSLFIYIDVVSKIFEGGEMDKYLYLLSILTGGLSFWFFYVMHLDTVNIVFMGLYAFMLFACYISDKTQRRIEEDKDIFDND